METMVAAAENLGVYLESFEALGGRIAGRVAGSETGNEPAWLKQRREAGMQRFSELGIPTVHDEDWKYTSLATVARKDFQLAGPATRVITPDQIGSAGFNEIEGCRLVFVNGRFSADLSRLEATSKGVVVGRLGDNLGNESVEAHLGRLANSQDHALAALNTAFIEDGAFVQIPDRAVVEKPIHLVFVTLAEEANQVCHPRTLILAGRDSQATVVETYVGMGESYWTNAVTEVVTGENARLDHYKLQQEHVRALHTGFTYAHQARDSRFASSSLSFGGQLVRSDTEVRLNGEGCECVLNGLYAVTGHQHIDHHTIIDHAMPHCNSHQLYCGILDGHSTGVFNGKVIVRQDAQKTDAKQSNKNLLLSRNAEINTKPQLEIDANDVRCTHGATVGQIDDEAMFYLRSRGINRHDARSLLTYAFAADIIESLNVAPLRGPLEQVLLNWVEQAEVSA
jgi:Fe-S cluster assembly protein SufD